MEAIIGHHIELNRSQFQTLTNLIGAGLVVTAVAEPMDSDPPVEQLQMANNLDDAEDLRKLELFEDFTEKPRIKEMNDKARVEGKRTFKVYGITQLCIMLFTASTTHERVN